MGRTLINEAIIASEVLLIDEQGAGLGIVPRDEALALARQRGLDLVQDDIFSSPPRCRLAPRGQAAVQAKRAARIDEGAIKEIRVSTAMGTHDVEMRLRQAAGLLEKGYSVKLSARLSRAERGNPTQVRALLDKLATHLAGEGHIARKPFNESGALSLILAPREA